MCEMDRSVGGKERDGGRERVREKMVEGGRV